ncbi:TetR/AcrR family transcriptional regulator [Spongisporangium articulatum]|uniref:TetR/AcrR family transcriptional regulator n=1 Tax=Spongisporangium articulatum TaxID=3362603 RepID=A0ABW8AHZ2_9ACTN
MTEVATKPMRADAKRNRDGLMAAALTVFTRDGAEAPLEAVAREAGVGIGTLYRHFPSREALLEAVYRRENERLCARAAELLASEAPLDALYAWTDAFIDYAATKRGLAAALKSMIADRSEFFLESRTRMINAADSLLAAVQEAGQIPEGMSAEDLIRGMGGICMQPSPDPEQARRLVRLMIDGMRYRAS